jgi:hypothetical protein
MRRAPCILMIATLAALVPSKSTGHDFVGFSITGRSYADAVPPHLAPRARDSSTTRAMIDTRYLWEKHHKLSICFLEGSSALRHAVTTAMKKQWPIERITSGNLLYGPSFDTSPGDAPLCSIHTDSHHTLSDASDIIVSFSAGGGDWSVIGTMSTQVTPSMNFDNFMIKRPVDFQTIVGHEMGHALGLDHEHQSLNAPACRWNYNAIRRYSGWPAETIQRDLSRIQNDLINGKPEYIATQYDRESIMHYQLPRELFTDGSRDPCFIWKQNHVPSQTDVDAVRSAYSQYAPVEVNGVHKMLPVLKVAAPLPE